MRLSTKSGFCFLALFLSQALPVHAADLKPEDLIAHHLESLGTAAVRGANKSRVIQGIARFKMLVGGGGQLEGKAAVVSEERKLNIMMKFPNDYKGQQVESYPRHRTVQNAGWRWRPIGRKSGRGVRRKKAQHHDEVS